MFLSILPTRDEHGPGEGEHEHLVELLGVGGVNRGQLVLGERPIQLELDLRIGQARYQMKGCIFYAATNICHRCTVKLLAEGPTKVDSRAATFCS